MQQTLDILLQVYVVYVSGTRPSELGESTRLNTRTQFPILIIQSESSASTHEYYENYHAWMALATMVTKTRGLSQLSGPDPALNCYLFRAYSFPPTEHF